MKTLTTPRLKRTGVPWIGSVPEHWEVLPLGHLVNVASGATPGKERNDFWNGSIPWVSPKDMKRDVIVDSEDHVTEQALRETALKLIAPPAVLIVIRGMILDHTVPIAVTAAPVTLNQDMKALAPKPGVSARFLAHALRGTNRALLARVEEAAHGTKCLRTEVWRKVPMAVPPPDEQLTIAAFLDRKTAAIDALIAGYSGNPRGEARSEAQGRVVRLVELLREYRQALITAAVTGKIDVRNREVCPC